MNVTGIQAIRSFKTIGRCLAELGLSYGKIEGKKPTDISRELRLIKTQLDCAMRNINKILGTPKAEPAFEKPNTSGPTAQDMLTWLNGRATEIKVRHGVETVTLWHPDCGNSIEDLLVSFCEMNKIDIEQETESF